MPPLRPPTISQTLVTQAVNGSLVARAEGAFTLLIVKEAAAVRALHPRKILRG